MFPEINYIDDLLPHVKDIEEIKTIEKDGYTVFDYVYQGKDTFPNSFALECRGIKFDGNGRILARPFQKFFNLNEKERFEDIDWTQSHRTYEKLDGSMVHFCLVDGRLKCMTRKGITDVSTEACISLTPQIREFATKMCLSGWTPIFEYTSPDNRIVIRYDEPRLTLLAVRHNSTGKYSYARFNEGYTHGIPIPELFDPIKALHHIETVRQSKDSEGIVVAFDSGHRLKVKAELYVAKHHIKSNLELKKNWLKFALEGSIDDLVGLMDQRDWEELRDYSKTVQWFIQYIRMKIIRLIEGRLASHTFTRKQWALMFQENIPQEFLGVAFRVIDGEPSEEAIIDRIRKFTSTKKLVDDFNKKFLNL